MKTLYPKPQSICILRLSAIGDVCHAIATVQALQTLWPDAKLTWIVGKVEYQLLKILPNIEFIIFDKSKGTHSFLELRKQMHNRKFDILLQMQIAIRASIASIFIPAKHTWGFHKYNAKELQWLFTNHKIEVLQKPHVAEGFWAFAQALEKHYITDDHVPLNNTPTWKISIPEEDVQWFTNNISSKLSSSQSNNDLDQKYIVVSPTASNQNRNWSTDNYAAIADHAINHGFNVILTGSPSESDISISQSIVELAKNKTSIIDITGQSSLTQLLCVLKNAELLIAPDSGPAHMASIVNTSVIGLYAYSNPMRTGPYHSLDNTVSIYKELVEEQRVKSINDIRWGTRVKGNHMMSKITLDSVITKFNDFFNI